MDHAFTALDAIPLDRIPAAIAHLTTKLLSAPAAQPADELLTPSQVATLLRTSPRWVYRHQRDLGAIRVSRRKLRFKRSRVDQHLRRNAA